MLPVFDDCCIDGECTDAQTHGRGDEREEEGRKKANRLESRQPLVTNTRGEEAEGRGEEL